MLNILLAQEDNFTDGIPMSSENLYRIILNTIEDNGMIIPPHLETIAMLATHGERLKATSTHSGAVAGGRDLTESEAKRKSAANSAERWLRSEKGHDLNSFLNQLGRSNLDCGLTSLWPTLILVDSGGLNYGPNGKGSNKRPYNHACVHGMKFPNSYTRVPKNGTQYHAEDTYKSQSFTEVRAVCGGGMSTWMTDITEFGTRMKNQGISTFEVRIVDSGNDMTDPKDEDSMGPPAHIQNMLKKYENSLMR